ncbi:MAG TPA: hypothetical protein VGN08_08295 [Solirubrobacteraceae bacterium]|jgi:hypothetical protein
MERRRHHVVCLLVLMAGALLIAAPAASAGLPPFGLAPTPRWSGGRVQWAPVGVESYYKLAISEAPRGTPGRPTVYVTVPRTQEEDQFYTPRVPAGKVIYVGVSADGGLTWSTGEATVNSRLSGVEEGLEAEQAEATGQSATLAAPRPAAAPSTHTAIIGTNDGVGWGTQAAQTMIAAHITWNRVDLASESNTLTTSLRDGFKVLAIVGNTDDSAPLSRVDPKRWGAEVVAQLKGAYGISIAEAANEAYRKGDVADPVRYGRMYLSAVEGMAAAGIRTRLLFNMTGDYPHGSWSSPEGWSEDSRGGGWLRTAVAGVPGLAAAIRANGISTHPYGAVGQDDHDVWGVGSVAADEAVARSVLGSVPPIYVTEFGYDLNRCGDDLGACSNADQAAKLKAAYRVLLADPAVAGIWWYQSHDDGSIDSYGFMNDDNSPRPSFWALSGFAVAAGQ